MPVFTISAPRGELSLIPEARDYIVEWNGYTDCDSFEVTENGHSIHFECVCREGRTEIRLQNISGEVCIRYLKNVDIRSNQCLEEIKDILLRCQGSNIVKNKLYYVFDHTISNLLSGIKNTDDNAFAPINDTTIKEFLLCAHQNGADRNMVDAVLEILSIYEAEESAE